MITEMVMGIRAGRLDRMVEEEGVEGVAEARVLMVEAGVIGRIKIVAPKSGVRRTEIVVEDGGAAAVVAAALVGVVAGQEEMMVVLVGMLVVQGGVMPRRVPMMAEEVGDAVKRVHGGAWLSL